ncbi:MAG: CIA30 family protein, partial [Pseudomonadota bacterium]
MQFLTVAFSVFVLLMTYPTPAFSDPSLIDDFQSSPEKRWSYIADTVMGGRSSGVIEFQTENNIALGHLFGTVSTENNGGFIQIRRKLDVAPSDGVIGFRLKVRGNNQRYFVHVRTSQTVLPWQYYQASFFAGSEWREVKLDLADFEPSGSKL